MTSLFAAPMRQYSIIVPATGSQSGFEKTLASVLRYLPAGSEVVVPCPHDFQDVHGLEGEVSLVRLDARTKPELPELFRAALENSSKELVGLFLPGVELTGEWHNLVSPRFDDPVVAAVSPVLYPASPESVDLSGRGSVAGLRIDRQQKRRFVKASKRGGELQIDGPLTLAAIFRNDAFGWLEMDKTGLSGGSLEIELAAGLKSLDYLATGIPDWHVVCDSELLDDCRKSQVDGEIEERIIRRHSSSGRGSMPLRVLLDLLRGRAGSAFGRVLSIRHGKADDRFHQHLMQGKLEREKLCRAVNIRRTESSHSESVRRAA